MRTGPLARACLFLHCLAGAIPLFAQDASGIINQYVKAAGGSGRLAKVQTLVMEGTLARASDGKTGTFTLDCKSPNRYYMEIIVGEQPEILAYNGKSAWHLSAKGEAATLLGPEALQLEAASFFANSHLLNLKKSKIGAALLGPAKVGDHDTMEVEATLPTGV